MFTGIVETVGKIAKTAPLQNGIEMIISANDAVLSHLKIGDSISVNGVCSTVSSRSSASFTVQYMKETLEKTTCGLLQKEDDVNLELSLTPSSAMGGHQVTGHVDQIGVVKAFLRQDPWGVLTIKYDKKFRPFLIKKGSICLDGISLTLTDVQEDTFTCHLIPHTLENTVLKFINIGQKINIEYDIVGKYLYNFYLNAREKSEGLRL